MRSPARIIRIEWKDGWQIVTFADGYQIGGPVTSVTSHTRPPEGRNP